MFSSKIIHHKVHSILPKRHFKVKAAHEHEIDYTFMIDKRLIKIARFVSSVTTVGGLQRLSNPRPHSNDRADINRYNISKNPSVIILFCQIFWNVMMWLTVKAYDAVIWCLV